jgi:Arc/MetJ family transcription regulator
MRTHIDIDEELMKAAQAATGLGTKKEVVELGLITLVRLNRQEAVGQLWGKLHWEGDIDAMRTDS